MTHRLAILGFGTVGRGVCEILKKKKDYLSKTFGFDFIIVAVSDLFFGNVYDPDGLDIDALLVAGSRRTPFKKNLKDWDNLEMIRESRATIVLELTHTDFETGEPAITHCKTALEAGKHVLTSNKGPVALGYAALKKIADQNNVRFLFEGTVCSGTPVINLAAGPLAGCGITGIKGILNGTTNFILTEMEKGMTYEQALETAQQKGYAEADPAADVEGYDARGKVAILSSVVMGKPLKISAIPCRGITGITRDDIRSAAENNKRWKLIGSIESTGGEVRASVSPEQIDLNHPLAGINGTVNAVTFTTDLLGDVTITGPGAGGIETGFAIVNDLININRVLQD